MGMLLKLLTLPVSGPILGTKYVMDTVVSEAERQYYDQRAILQQLNQLERHHQEGQISQQEMREQEEALLQRLMEARDYHQRKQEEEDAREEDDDHDIQVRT